MNLVVQTATEMLYVPAREIASLIHLPAALARGPGRRLGPAGVPDPRRRFLAGPGGVSIPYTPLPEIAEEPEEEEELPPGLLAVEYRDKKWIRRTETEELECELSSNQLREIFPSLLGQGRRNTLPR